jgi:hypothetical protein
MFCTMPFTHAYLHEDGDLHLCCPGWLNRTAGSILEANALDLWKGTKAWEIRGSILDGSFRHCARCQFLPGPKECVVDVPPHDMTVDGISVLTLNHDPTCNLGCGSCRLVPRGSDPIHSAVHDALLRSGLLSKVERLSASGSGDPVASRLIWPMLCRLSSLGCRPEMALTLQTNGLLLGPEKWAELGIEAGRVTHLSVSVDAASEATYRRLRGGDWRRLMGNLAWMGRLGRHLQLNFVVQDANLGEMEGFVRLAKSVSANRVYFSVLNNWGTYSDDDYLGRAVHLPGHPRHLELLETISRINVRLDSLVTLIGFPEGSKMP